jgi:hypothetical protein
LALEVQPFEAEPIVFKPNDRTFSSLAAYVPPVHASGTDLVRGLPRLGAHRLHLLWARAEQRVRPANISDRGVAESTIWVGFTLFLNKSLIGASPLDLLAVQALSVAPIRCWSAPPLRDVVRKRLRCGAFWTLAARRNPAGDRRERAFDDSFCRR